MKLNKDIISEIEEKEGAILLTRLQKEKQYMYVKARARIPDKIFYVDIPLKNGSVHSVAFIRKADLTPLERDERFGKTPKAHRKFRGRPFKFCAGCVYERTCTPEIECGNRKAYEDTHKEVQDDRYWKNGVPKKHMILCQYAKYRYAHKRTAGQCQEEKCRFYKSGKCELGLSPNT